VTEGWRILHNEEFHNFSSPNIIRMVKSMRMRWVGHVASLGDVRNPYKILIGQSKGKRPLRRPKLRWEDNIEMNCK
jgi:hypothetical protein